jgi:hypothetical protein
MPDNFEEETHDLINELMIQGAIDIVGIDSETGDFLYTFTEKLATANPKIYNAMMEDLYSSMMRLWEAGFFSMDVTDKDPVVKATEKVFDKEAIQNLPRHDQFTLQDILKKMSE